MYLEAEEEKEVVGRENMMDKEYPLASVKPGQFVVSPSSLVCIKSDFSIILDTLDFNRGRFSDASN